MKDHKIVVVDDEKEITEIVQVVLEKNGFNALTYNNVNEALEYLIKNKIDLLITDLQMGVLSGVDVVNYTRDYQPNLAVIIISAYFEEFAQKIMDIKKLNDVSLLPKPIDTQKLIELVKEKLS